MLITPDQIRAARALLRMDQEDLARRANVSVVTVRRLEAPGGLGSVSLGTVEEVQRALEQAGAEFIERGVRRRQRSPEEVEARVQAVLRTAALSAKLLNDAPPFSDDDLYDENGLPA
jgi:transcriptional regulator with XRE-family HTH domain